MNFVRHTAPSSAVALIQWHSTVPLGNCQTLVHEFSIIYDHTKLNYHPFHPSPETFFDFAFGINFQLLYNVYGLI